MRRPPTTAYNPRPTTQGIFSSLPLSFFSTSVPNQVIHLFASNGGTSLPRPIPPNLFISEFNNKHPFYNVDLFFIAGPSDPLMTLLQRRTLVLYDCTWVEESTRKGEMVPLEKFVLAPERIQNVEQVKPEAEEGEDDKSVAIETTTRIPVEAEMLPPISQGRKEQVPALNPDSTSSSHVIGGGDQSRLSERLASIPTVYVEPTAFVSQEAIINAVHKRATTIPNKTASPRPKSKNPTSSSMNSKSTSTTKANRHAKAGPSRLHLAPLVDDTGYNDEFIAFQPTSTPSRPPTSSRHISSSPVRLHIPHKILDQKKVSRFIKKFQNSVQCELDDVYVRALEGECGGYKIMGLEEGRLD